MLENNNLYRSFLRTKQCDYVMYFSETTCLLRIKEFWEWLFRDRTTGIKPSARVVGKDFDVSLSRVVGKDFDFLCRSVVL